MENFWKLRFGSVGSILDMFIRDDFNYENEIKPCMLVESKNGEQVLVHSVLGIKKEDLKIKFITKYGKRYLDISGKSENEFGLKFSINNSFPVTKFLDEENVRIKLEDGIAYITLPIKISESLNEKYINIE